MGGQRDGTKKVGHVVWGATGEACVVRVREGKVGKKGVQGVGKEGGNWCGVARKTSEGRGRLSLKDRRRY